MSDDTSRFGELRSVLAGKRNRAQWLKLCRLLEQWQDHVYFLDVVLPYALDQLQAWPDDLRVAPGRWLNAAAKGEPTPWLSVALDAKYVGKNRADKVMARLLSCAGLEHVRSINFEENSSSSLWADAFASATHLHALTSMNLRLNHFNRELLERIIQADAFYGMCALDISNCRIYGKNYEVLLGLDLFDHPHCQHLRQLTYQYNAITPQTFKTLIASPHLQQLTSLNLKDCLAFHPVEAWRAVIEEVTHMPELARFESMSLSAVRFDGTCQGLWSSSPYAQPQVREISLRGWPHLDDYGVLRESDYLHIP